ncbi:MAG: hypothetical protein K8W52_44780 [Deltaproteobacteria bacterium]|nr:hypothetical protein [Deltaproteobacteria bacterium]
MKDDRVARPRHLAHRGSVIAVGIVLDPTVIGELAARRRALAWWTPGARVIASEARVIVVGAAPRRVRAELAPGAPLVAQHGVIAALPLDTDDIKRFAPDVIVVAEGGVARAIDTSHPIDVATWIDLDDHALADVRALAPPPARAVAPVIERVDLRAAAGVAELAPEARQLQAALANAGQGAARKDAPTEVTPTAAPGAIATHGSRSGSSREPGRPSRWQRTLAWLAHKLGPSRRALPAAGASAAGAPASGSSTSSRASDADALPAPPPRPSWLDRLRERLALALWRSRLGEVLGRNHAEYLRETLAMFDRGDLDQALRRAIPIGDGERDGPTRLALEVPKPRRDLALAMAPPGARTAIPVGEDATEMLRGRYRAAAARLERDLRIEDAAFVLADLLGDVDAALALLERHDRFALAARLAEARGRPPGLVVRLWFKAGDRARAERVARRHGAWADAIARLERGGDAEAAALRLAWAGQLAAAGDYLQAIEIAWPLRRPDNELATWIDGWIDRGIAGGGTAAARLLVRRLAIAPARFAEVAPALVAFLDDLAPDAAWRRVALVETLLAMPPSPELRAIARPAVRALIADVGRGADGDSPTLLPKLVRYADDAALRVDQPTYAAAERRPMLVDRAEPLRLVRSAADAGTVAIHDVALLPGGRVLLALGELGVRLVARDGHTIAHLDQPATQLAVSDHGTHAIALADRGSVHRLARLDLVQRRAAHWCDAELGAWAPTYDGDQWWTARGNQVALIDATARGWSALWAVDLQQFVVKLRRDGAVTAIATQNEAWFYEGVTLRRRRAHAALPDGAGMAFRDIRPAPPDPVEIILGPDGQELRFGGHALPLGPAPLIAFDVDSRFAAIAQRADDAVVVSVVHLERMGVVVHLTLAGAETAAVRLDDGTVAIADDRGRALAIDLRTGQVTHDLRLQP